MDFNDIVHPFARAVVEGLCGFQPNYPLGSVLVSPQFPSTWAHAAFSTPDFDLDFTSSPTGTAVWQINLTQAARMDIHIPVPFATIASVSIDGESVYVAVSAGVHACVTYPNLPQILFGTFIQHVAVVLRAVL